MVVPSHECKLTLALHAEGDSRYPGRRSLCWDSVPYDAKEHEQTPQGRSPGFWFQTLHILPSHRCLDSGCVPHPVRRRVAHQSQ